MAIIDLVRHGEPEGGWRYRSATDDPLTVEGWRQMDAAVSGKSPWQRIYTSPLRRCSASARPHWYTRVPPDMRGRYLQRLIFVLTLWCSAGVHAVTLTDDRGHELTLEHPAARIVSLAPNLTELLFEAGAGDRLIGAVAYSDYPAAAQRVPRIGEAARIDIERILALKPDLIVAWKSGNNREDYAQIERLGFKVYVVEIDQIARIPDKIEDLGHLTGTLAAARISAAAFRARFDSLQQRYAGRERVSVFYQIWERPLMTVNGVHFISDTLRLCGGENIFSALDLLAPTVDLEAVIGADPQVILINTSAGAVDNWRRWPTVTAARLDNLFTISDDLISRPTSRLLDGMEQLCGILDTARTRIHADVH